MNCRLPVLREKTAKLTTSPGVYLMKDQKSEIIYIGKAKNLKNRVTSYFRESADHTPKVASMVEHVYDYDFIVTDSEYEALVLECSLIKQHQPKYNILLKDDKGYTYLCFSEEPYPRLTVEKNKKKAGTYLGPYMSGYVAREAAKEANRVFQLPTCRKRFPEDFKKTRPCLNYHIKQCMGVCRGCISQKDYAEVIQQAKAYIQMGSTDSVKRMQEEMERAAEALDFERAAMLRDRIAAVTKAGETQKIMDAALEEADVIAMAEHMGTQCVSILRYRGRRLFDKETFFFQENASREEVMDSYLTQYYEHHRGEIPKNIVLEFAMPDPEMYEQLFTNFAGRRVHITVPQRGTLCQFVQLSRNNANEELAIRFNRTGREVQALEELGAVLGLPQPPQYIEAYDISNISGFESVGSMVVYEKGKPKRSDYRKFKIKWVQGPNDYASMEEVLTRRFTHESKGEYDSFSILPDLILMDGGRGQVNIARKVLGELGIDIPVCGMVKDDNHRTRGVYFNNVEIPIDTSGEGFHLVTRIQDEAHRFAIEYHRSLRSKEQVHSVLDDIPGIGETRRKALMRRFRSVENIRDASVEELSQTESMNVQSAEAVYQFFHRAPNHTNA